MKTNKTQKPTKPIKPIHIKLIACLWAWLVFAIIGYPVLVAVATGVSLVSGVLIQMLILLPALFSTPYVLRGNSPYALIVVSLVLLVYLGVSGVLVLIGYYESASVLIWGGRLVEFVLIGGVLYYLFVLLRCLPPMHRQ
ncbi:MULTISPECIES: hypothetical protein [unclassified Moraxella]|uniref:hypothetical protein n=1 Tax=unclassified Moraxella TaxID=2685852 RepID=UPI00359DADFC